VYSACSKKKGGFRDLADALGCHKKGGEARGRGKKKGVQKKEEAEKTDVRYSSITGPLLSHTRLAERRHTSPGKRGEE